MTVDISVPSEDQPKSMKKERRRNSTNITDSEVKFSKASLVSSLYTSSSSSSFGPMMTSPTAGHEHGGLLALGHAGHVRQFAGLPQIGGHLSAFNHLHHLNLKSTGGTRSDSRSSSEAGEVERPKSRNANSPPSSSPSSSPPRPTEAKRNDSDSEIEVDDDSERKRFKPRSTSTSGIAKHSIMSSSSFFINDILKSSHSPPSSSELQNALFRASNHPSVAHLSPPSTPPNPAFNAQDFSLRASAALHSGATVAGHPNAYSLFAAAMAAAAAKPPETANAAAAAAAGFFGPGHNLLLPHAAALNAIRPPFSMHGLSLEQMNAVMHHHHQQQQQQQPGAPASATTGAATDSDADMDGDALDDDICSSTEGDDDRQKGQ